MFRLLSIIAFAAFASGSPILEFGGKIVGGKQIDIKQAPYQVSLFTNGRFLCGGSIISKDYVLTAAHCSVYRGYTVRAGSSYNSDGGSIHTVQNVKVHEKYGLVYPGLLINDIALMKVSPPFELDETRKPAPLVGKGVVLTGYNGIISGWGTTSEGGFLPRKLQAVEVPLISREDCQRAYQNVGKIPDGEICAGYPEGGKDSCQGDSGGPFVVSGKLVGIVSWGLGCAKPNTPGVYTEVAYYRDWIYENSGL